ncbi:RDD family protein [Solitalea sp. MAHUQ-68]|uniref:RDD family protein n=1 Tax=Solitalea agri TaxID=2953739 RepID=A0A9X2F397_9SPHI|nr:RDD family protein [Solitalea agri]MCO4291586.1 RDD family protein [Solitalea agri]
MSEILEEKEKQGSASDLHIASSATRFANYLIDSMFIGMVLSFIMPNSGVDLTKITTIQQLVNDSQFVKMTIINTVATFAYYFIAEAVFGQTLGKIITRTHVVNDYGEKPGVLRILGRTLCRSIPFEAFSFLFTPMGWHDSISKTYVVKKQPIIQS